MEINLQYREGKKGKETQVGVLHLFEADFHSTWLANSMANSQKPIFSGRKSTEFF